MTYEEKDTICHYVVENMICPINNISPDAFNALTTKFHFFCGFLNEMIDKQEEK